MPNLVSIIMPAYNAEKYIGEAIESVIAQTYNSWELIIIDDESHDRTKEIIKEYVNLDSRIHYLYQQNKGQGAARNKGISYCKGEIIAFLDADDIWIPEKLSIQLFHFLKSNSTLIFSSAFIIENEKNNVIGEFVQEHLKSFDLKNSLESFIEGNPVPILTVLALKKNIIEVGGFSEEPSLQNVEDYHLWLRLLINNYSFISIKNKLALYRRHPLQSTRNRIESRLQEILLLNKMKNDYPEFNAIFIKQMIKLLIKTTNLSNEKKDIIKIYQLCEQIFTTQNLSHLLILLKYLPLRVFKKYFHLYIHLFNKSIYN